MAQQTLNVGTNANDGTGDTLRAAMVKVNENFTEVYASPLFNDGIVISGNEIRANRSNDDLVFKPSGTGTISFPAIRINDNNIEGTRSNEDINLLPSGTGSVVFGAIKINGTTISSDDSSLVNVNDNLNVDGNLTIEGTATIEGATTTTGITVDSNINITDNEIKATTSNSDLILSPAGTGNVIAGAITINGTSLSSTDSSTININEGLIVDGTATIEGAVTLDSTLGVGTNLTTDGNLVVTGTSNSMAGTVTIDNLTFNDNIIGSSSNADILITPGGTGKVYITDLTVDSEINITDNTIKTTNTNADLNITPSGTGQVVIAKADINSGTVDNTVIGGTTPAAGTFTTLTASTSVTIDGITITDNTVSTNASNSPLELTGNGTGGVNISGFTFPTTDGSNGQFIKTNGSGVLSFASAGASLSYSDLADATVTIASSAATNLDTFAKADYRSAKYWISITDASNSRYEIVEANVIHDGSNAYVATFGSTTSYSAPLCTFSADISGSNVRLRVVNITSNSIVFKYQRIAIDV